VSVGCVFDLLECTGYAGFERQEPGLRDIAALAALLLPEGGMFAWLARHRAEVFPYAEYADLFTAPGWASGRCRPRGWWR
jgi:hypothetical protein